MVEILIQNIRRLLNSFFEGRGIPAQTRTNIPPEGAKMTQEAGIVPDPYLDTIVPWVTQKDYFHNVRVLCDRAGLSFLQKNIVCACIYVESRFRDRYSDGTPVRNFNKNPDGSVWSTDWGLVQVNDWPKFGHIGIGCRFKSVEDVLSHPERSAQWMIDTMKKTGRLQPWASYTTGAYKQYLLPSSPMWLLRT